MQKMMAESRNLDAASVQKIADANLKVAQETETYAGIENDRNSLILNAQKQAGDQRANILKTLNSLPV